MTSTTVVLEDPGLTLGVMTFPGQVASQRSVTMPDDYISSSRMVLAALS